MGSNLTRYWTSSRTKKRQKAERKQRTLQYVERSVIVRKCFSLAGRLSFLHFKRQLNTFAICCKHKSEPMLPAALFHNAHECHPCATLRSLTGSTERSKKTVIVYVIIFPIKCAALSQKDDKLTSKSYFFQHFGVSSRTGRNYVTLGHLGECKNL